MFDQVGNPEITARGFQQHKSTNIIVFNGSFHGRTHMTMAMTTSKTGYRAGYSPLPSGIYVTPAS